MRFTGKNDFGKNEATDFTVEKLATLPVHQADDFGRLIFVTTLGPTFGLHLGTSTGWLQFSTAGMVYTRDRFDFIFWRIGAGVSKNLHCYGGIVEKRRTEYNGYIVGVTVQLKTPRTAGTVTVKPMLNGSVILDTALDTVLDASNPEDNTTIISPDLNFYFTAGDKLGLQATTTAGLLPVPVDLTASLAILYV